MQTELEKKHENRPNSGSIIFLSLFLLLLAFFILLNALATIEETKSRQVLTSVAATFRSVVDADTNAQVLLSEFGPVPEPEELLAAFEQLWVTAIPVTRVERIESGQAMQMTIPANELFLGGEDVLRTDRKALLERVVKVVSLPVKGAVQDLKVVLGSDPVSGDELDRGGNLPMRRAVILARTLVEAGAKPDRIGAGIRVGESKSLSLRFAVRAAARARVAFEELATQ